MEESPARAAWERVYRDVAGSVYRALVATLRDRELARDALHEAFAEGIRKPPPHDANIGGWLFRVALRRTQRGPYRPLLAQLTDQLWPSAGRDDIAELLDRLEAGKLLQLLTERQRSMVVAQYYLDMDQSEIARLFNVRRGTVAATLSQALMRMRRGAERGI